MPETIVEMTRRALEANRSGTPEETVDRAAALVDDDFEFVSRLASVEGTVYRGREGLYDYYRDMADAWETWRIDVASVAEVVPNIVLAEARVRATARSGVEIGTSTFPLFRFSGGKLCRIDSYGTRQEALDAAGSEQRG